MQAYRKDTFFCDFVYSLWIAPSKVGYLKWGWLDLVASIPMVEPFRVARVARIIRIIRVLRGFHSSRRLVEFILQNRAQGAFTAVLMISFVLIVFSSIAILHFEHSPTSNIQTPDDAIWWSFVTITTVGYGDRYPVTVGGRLVSALLMTAGIGLFGTFTGLVASSFLSPGREDEQDDVKAPRAELAEMRRMLERMSPPERT